MKRLLMLLVSGLMIWMLLSGCGPANNPEPEENAASPDVETPQEDLALTDPQIGLEKLVSYRSELVTGFRAEDGSEWSQTYTLTSADGTARWLIYSEQGLDGQDPQYPALAGMVDGILYYRSAAETPCVLAFAEADADLSTALPEPAGLLPAFQTMALDGDPETINGVQAQAYALTAESFGGDGQQVTGRVWMAQDGGQVLQYELEVHGGEELFGPGHSGAMYWNYSLTLLDPTEPFLPPGCPQALPDLPLLAGAQNITRFPGFISYQTDAGRDEITAFYDAELTRRGFNQTVGTQGNESSISLQYQKDSLVVQVVAAAGQPGEVMIFPAAGQAAEPANPGLSQAEPTTPAIDASAEMADRVAGALSVLLGDENTPPAFPGFHLESVDRAPAWDRKIEQVGESVTMLNADVEGLNVHFTLQENGPGAASDFSEVYILGAEEYEVTNGQVESSLGLAGLAWVTYPIDPTMLLSLGSLSASAAGEEIYEGRPAEVYYLDASSLAPGGEMLAGLPFKAVKGSLWVDTQTGALLKLELDYERSVRSTSGEVMGSGSGRIEIRVTRIGEISVQLP